MAKKSRDNVLIPKATTSVTFKSKVANYQPTNNAVTNKSSFENKLLPVKKTTPLNNFEPLINQQLKSTEKKSLTLPSTLTNVTCSLGPTDCLTIRSDKCVTVIVNENITEQKYIKNISGAESICVGTVDSSNNFTTVVNDVSRIGFDTNSGLNVVCLESGLSKIFSTNVYSINSLNGNVTLSAGNNIAIGSSGNTLTICGLIPNVVTGINSLVGDITLSAGNNISIGTSGNTLTFCSTDTTTPATPTTLGTTYAYNDTTSGNTFIGYCAGNTTATGSNNIAIGQNALHSHQTNQYYGNIALGYCTLYSNTEGYGNIAIGDCNLVNNTTGSSNIVIGQRALFDNTTGYSNIAIGYYGMRYNTMGCYNLAIGTFSLANNISGYKNIAIGCRSLYGNTVGYGNLALGDCSLGNNTSGYGNTAIGTGALAWSTTGYGNVAVGQNAGCQMKSSYNTTIGYGSFSNTPGCNNIGLGAWTGNCTLTGANNIAIGYKGLRCNVNGSDNVALGTCNLFNNVCGCNVAIGSCALAVGVFICNNVAVGYKALYCNQFSDNVAIGHNALANIGYVNGSVAVGSNALVNFIENSGANKNNIAIGYCSGCAVTTGFHNTIIGQLSGTPGLVCTVLVGAGTCERIKVDSNGLYINGACWSSGGSVVPATPTSVGTVFGSTNSSSCNAFLGYCAGNTTMTGNWNVAIGTNALTLNSGGYYNVAIGNFAGYGNQIAIGNVAIGAGALCCNKLNFNTAVGYSALQVSTTGYGNSAVGSYASACNSTGCFNTTVGFCAGYCVGSGTRNVLIGACAGNAITTGINNTIIGTLPGSQGLQCTLIIGAGTCERLKVDDNGLCINGSVYARVCSINTLTNNVTLSAGTNVTIGASGNTLTICSSAGNPSLDVYCSFKIGNGLGSSTGISNLAIGCDALVFNTTGADNVALGNDALYCNTAGLGNVAIGKCSLACVTSQSGSVGIGYCAGTCGGGSENVYIGCRAGALGCLGTASIMIGSSAGLYNRGSQNVFIGTFTGQCTGVGYGNVFIGCAAGLRNSTGCYNIYMGATAGFYGNVGRCNVGLGYGALRSNITGSSNIAIGRRALYTNGSGNDKIAIGRDALCLDASLTGSNIAIGLSSSAAVTTGVCNLTIGTLSGCSITTGSNNTIIGSLIGSAGLVCTLLIGAGTCERLKVDDNGLCINGSLFTGGGVTQLNTLTGSVTLSAGTNVTIGTSGNTLTICSNASGLGGTVTDVATSGSGLGFSLSGGPITTTGTVSLTVPSASDLSTCLQGTGLDATSVGYRIVPQNSQSISYTLQASDSGKHIYHPSSDTTPRTYTIPSDASVALPIGATFTFVNYSSAAVTIGINSDTLVLAGTGGTGNRTLAQFGFATAMKVENTVWFISGAGLT